MVSREPGDQEGLRDPGVSRASAVSAARKASRVPRARRVHEAPRGTLGKLALLGNRVPWDLAAGTVGQDLLAQLGHQAPRAHREREQKLF